MTRLVIAGVLFVVSACSTAPAVSTSARRIHAADEARAQPTEVRAGTPFRMRMDTSVGTAASEHGDRFSAVIIRPLLDTRGVVVVPSGARVVGRVASVRGATGPRIRLDLERVETLSGWAPIHARLESADAIITAGPPEYTMTLTGDNSLLEERHAETSVRARVFAGERVGGGPTGYFYRVYRPRSVIVPGGAMLDMVLTRPLLSSTH